MRARDERTGRVVALKEILHLGNDDVARRFAREARVTANLMHPAIVPVYELGRWPTGEPFFAMKLVAGESFKDVIDATTSIADRLAKLSIVTAVADALAYAHGHRVIHRDLKPGNVLVGEYGETVVIDWGLAKQLDAPDEVAAPSIVLPEGAGDQTVAGAIMGTPFYMPPEQALGNAADQRADVYAIGAMLYHLITGAPPFADQKPKDMAHLLSMVSSGAPTPLAEREGATPPDLVTIVEKAMARSADARYPSARELADELRRFATGQLVRAHRYSRRALVWRWIRRHRAAVTVGAVLLALLVGGAVISIDRIVDERDRAVVAERTATDEATRARRGLATALLQKGRGAELEQRWALAAMYYAASRTYVDSPDARWAAGLAEARAITPHARHLGHAHPINAAAITPDGRHAVTVDQGGTVRLWSLGDGALIATRTVAGGGLWAVAVAPDGRELAIGGDAGVIYRLTPDLAPISELRGHTKRVWSLAYAPGGAALASASEDAAIRLWTLPAGDSRELRGHLQRVYSVAFSPDGTQLVSGSDDREVRVWNVATGTPRPIGTHVGGGIRVVAFAPDGQHVLSTGWNYEIKLWSLGGGAPMVWSDRHSVHAAAFTPDGRALVTAGDSGAIRVWEATTRALVTTLDAPGGRTTSLAVSRDGRWLVAAGHHRAAIVYDLRALGPLLDAGGHRAQVSSIEFTEAGDTFVTGSDDRTIRVWNTKGNELRRLSTGAAMCNESAHSVAGTVVAACDDFRIRRWDAQDRELATWPTTRVLEFLSVADDGKTLAGGHLDGVLQIIDLATGAVTREQKLHAHQIYIVEHASDGTLLTGGLDNTVKRWTADLAPIRTFTARTSDGLLAAGISPDRRFVVAAGQDGSLDVWNAQTGASLAQLSAHAGLISDLVFAHDSRRLYTAGDDDRVVKIWDTATWKQVGTLEANEGGVTAVARSPDGALLVTGHRSSAIVIWDVATGRPRLRVGGRARDHGTCDDLGVQVWGDEVHRELVLAACRSAPDVYFARYASRSRLRIVNEVDVVEDWR